MSRQPGYDTFGPQQPPEYADEKWIKESLNNQKRRNAMLLVQAHYEKPLISLSSDILTILDSIYSANPEHSFGIKIKMIKTLRILGRISTGNSYPLKEAKSFIETNWTFDS